MAKEKLFPRQKETTDPREPHKRFEDFAAKIVAVPKSEIDKRESDWQRNHPKTPKP